MQKMNTFLFLSLAITMVSSKIVTAQLFSGEIIIVKPLADGPHSIFAADLDGDGDMDILSASNVDDKIAWYENINGNIDFFNQRVITTLADEAMSVFAQDIDNDGDIDVLSASQGDDKIAWYENLDGAGNFGPQKIVSSSANGAISVLATDIDGDNDMDIVAALSRAGKVVWYENTDGAGSFSSENVMSSSLSFPPSVVASDLDGDGDMDVVSAATFGGIIVWFQNLDGLGNFSTQKIISSLVSGPYSVFAADLDGDDDFDVLSATSGDHEVAWYENTDGLGNFGTQVVISSLTYNARSVYAADLDNDNDIDVLSVSKLATGGDVVWYENTDGLGNFGAQTVISTFLLDPVAVYATDIDGDGDADVLAAARTDDKVAWFENLDSNDSFNLKQYTHLADDAYSVFAADLDSDGDLDVLSASRRDDKIAWYENLEGHGDFGVQNIISTSADAVTSVYAADLDGDGDMDILSASNGDNKIAWYENTQGLGSFGPQKIITTLALGAGSVFAIDLDNDGDIDVLSASFLDDKIAWYENIDGLGNFSDQNIITTSADIATSVYAGDLDGDGDIDVLSSSAIDNKIAWYENTDGQGTFSTQKIITLLANGASDVYAADIDGDADLDVISTSWNDDKVAWYENLDGKGNFGTQNIISASADFAMAVFVIDLDGDGDTDVLSASSTDYKIAWYENTDGQGNFSNEQIITIGALGAQSVFAADLDNDGNIDVLSASRTDDKIAWYRNLSNPVPVELSSFSARLTDNTIHLFWRTESESNNFGFEIQRKLDTDTAWNVIGFVRGFGTSSQPKNYEFLDRIEHGAAVLLSVKYRLRQIDTNGLSDFSEPITIFFEVPTSIKLNQNYPNPFNPTTTISYSIPNSDWVTLKVYNIKGSEVKALVNSKQKAGNHFVSFDASGLANGVYYYRLQIGEFVYTKKLIFLK